MGSRSRLVELTAAVALAASGIGCLGNSSPGTSDVLFALLVDPQWRKEHLSAFDEPAMMFCAAMHCTVRVEMIDLTNHSRIGGFSVPGTAQTTGGAPTGYAVSFAVSQYGDRVYIGERMAEEVQAYNAGGALLGTVAAGTGHGGPMDMVLSSDDSTLFVLDARGISRIRTATMTNIGRWNANEEAVFNGLFPRIALSAAETHLVVTTEAGWNIIYLVRTSDMQTGTSTTIGPFPDVQCDQAVDDVLFTPYERLLVFVGACHLIYQYDLPTGLYFSGFEIKLGGTNMQRHHMAYSKPADKVYTSVLHGPDSASELIAASPTTSVQSLGRVRGMITDVATNVAGIAAYYSVSWSWTSDPHESRRLAVVHTPTGILSDSVYFFPTTAGNQLPPRVMEMQVVRKILAPNEQPAARRDP